MATQRQLLSIKNAVTEDWSGNLIAAAWNEYCDRHGNSNERIYPMGQLEEHIGNKPLRQIIDICNYGDIHPDDDYFEYNGHGNIMTFSDLRDSENFNIDYLVTYICQNKCYKAHLDRKRLLADFAYTYNLTEEEGENIVAASNRDIVIDDWDLIYNEGRKAYSELLADNE